MKTPKFIDVLTGLGLSAHEAQIYFASLSLGPSTIQKIAEAAEVKRTTAYSVVESLQHKGLMSVHIKGFKKLYAAEDPDTLKTILDSKKEGLNSMLPDLTSLYNLKGQESLIKYYKGLPGIKSVYESLIRDVRPHEDYLVVSDLKQWINLDREFFENFTARRAKLNIKIRMLFQDSEIARDKQKFQKNINATIKILPQNTKLTTNLVVIPRRVVIHQLIPPVTAIVIENENVVRMHKETFEIMWHAIP